jgi:hypothetical protein
MLSQQPIQQGTDLGRIHGIKTTDDLGPFHFGWVIYFFKFSVMAANYSRAALSSATAPNSRPSTLHSLSPRNHMKADQPSTIPQNRAGEKGVNTQDPFTAEKPKAKVFFSLQPSLPTVALAKAGAFAVIHSPSRRAAGSRQQQGAGSQQEIFDEFHGIWFVVWLMNECGQAMSLS